MSESLKTVMVVEDDLILNLVYKKYVRSLGFILVGQPISGKEAIETAKREKPDLIIMDIGCRGNWTVLRQYKKFGSFLIALSYIYRQIRVLITKAEQSN